ncbi:MAG: DUF3857 domain-containing transglutaminase family protein [Pyrinomonadaceae bacterium]
MKCLLRFIVALLLFLIFLVPPIRVAANSDDWLPIDPSDLALKTPVVEKDADAEAIFWQVRVADDLENGDPRTVLQHYMRIKIFTDRGRESQSKVEIRYESGTDIKDIAARTIKPDGTVVELKKDDIFEKTIVKANGGKLKAKSFAMPSVEAGAVIEYRWREVRNNSLTFFDRFDLQRDIPVRLVKYYLKPAKFFTYESIGMNARTFHGNTTPFSKEKDGFYSTSMSNVPAFHEEPRMPPENELRAWMLVYYTIRENLPPEKFWAKLGKSVYENYKTTMKPTDEIKKTALEAVGDASTPEQKLRRIFDFCHSHIRNINDDAEHISREERTRMKENKNASDTLKRGFGTGEDIDVLFAAMANAAGFDARITRTSDRERYFFDMTSTDDFLLGGYNVAVKLDDHWRFFDPASKYVPFGMLRWQEEGQSTLISDPQASLFVKSPMSAPDKSKEKRIAKLRLTDDGTLEGNVIVEYTGHRAEELKEDNDADSAQQREDTLKEKVKERMSTAEISDIKIENVTDPDKPLVYAYHLKVPGYAQRTGKRLFLQPGLFEHGAPPMFATTQRRYAVYFTYPWSEEDDVAIDLPVGYALDNADSPGGFRAGAISAYEPMMGVANNGRTLIFKRKFYFGGQENILFPVDAYPQLKALFDNLNASDNHTITLKQAIITTATSPN